MKLKFETQVDGSYYELTSENQNFGYTLTQYTKTKKEDSKKEYNQYSLFYANLQQVAEKVLYLNLKGHNFDELLVSYNNMIERIATTLKKEGENA